MRAFVLAILLGAAAAAGAQDIRIVTTADPTEVGVGESFNYSISIESNANLQGQLPQMPAVAGLSVVSSSTSQNYQIMGAQMQATRTVTYGVVADKAGTFTIPAVRVEVNGKVFASNPVTVKVAASAPRPQRQTGARTVPAEPDEEQDEQDPQQAPQQPAEEQDALFLKATVSRRQVFQGEPLVYSSTLYSQFQLGRNTGILKEGEFPGFLVEKLEADNRIRTVQDRGRMFQSAELSRRVLVPTKPGKLTIQPEKVQAAVVVRRRPRRADPYDPFGGHFFDDPFDIFQRPQLRVVSAAPIEVEVLPLPQAGKPADFTGAVGTDFIVVSTHDKETLKENEVVTLTVTVKGKGDVRVISEPKLDVGADFKLFPAKATPKFEVTPAGLSGSKVFEIVLAPRGTGEKTIPGVSFSYFDTQQKKYVTKSTQPVKVTVVPGEKEERVSTSGAAPAQREEVKVVGSDLQYIHENPGELVPATEWLHGAAFWIAGGLPPVLVLLVWLWDRRRHRFESDVAWARRSRAYAAAKKQLGELRAGAEADPRKFYARLEQVMLEFVAGKLNRAAAGLVLDEVRGALTGANVGEPLLKRLEDLLSRCEEMRFAPGSSTDLAARGDDMETAEQLLAELEGVLS